MTAQAVSMSIKRAAREWQRVQPHRLGAAIAFYTLFSLVPLLIVIMSVAKIAVQKEQLETRLTTEASVIIGPEGGDFIRRLLENTVTPSGDPPSFLVGIILVFIGSTAILVQLQDALDLVLQTPPKHASFIQRTLKKRFISFLVLMIAGAGFLSSILLSTALTTLKIAFQIVWPDILPFLRLVNILLSIVGVTGLLALMYRYLPEQRMAWRDIWHGAWMTAVLFWIGKYIIGLYLVHKNIFSIYGAAGVLVIILLWTYYMAQIFLFGAALVRLSAERTRIESIEH